MLCYVMLCYVSENCSTLSEAHSDETKQNCNLHCLIHWCDYCFMFAVTEARNPFC